MTKGQLLALDKPENIKKQFGVGYKLLIEPKSNKISPQEFLMIKNAKIDPILCAEGYKKRGIIENSDSTGKKLIYQVPFSEVKEMQVIIKALEESIYDTCYIDVEMNSLEDAYINIAREEEKLLENLKKYGMRRLTDMLGGQQQRKSSG